MKLLAQVIVLLIVTGTVWGQAQATNPYQPGLALKVTSYPDTASIVDNIYNINDEGIIELPIIGKTKVSTLTEKQFVDFLRTKYAKYIRSTSFKIEVYYKISLLGGFTTPGLYYARPDDNLWDVIKQAGGFTEEDGFKKMKLFRGEKEVYSDLRKYYSKGLSLRQLNIKSGDILATPIPNPPVDNFTRFTQLIGVVTTAITVYLAYATMVVNARR